MEITPALEMAITALLAVIQYLYMKSKLVDKFGLVPNGLEAKQYILKMNIMLWMAIVFGITGFVLSF